MLESDPALRERVERLMTIPGVGVILALTWTLEIGDVTRFRTTKGSNQLLRPMRLGTKFNWQNTADANLEAAE